jgi:hypothetical protein
MIYCMSPIFRMFLKENTPLYEPETASAESIHSAIIRSITTRAFLVSNQPRQTLPILLYSERRGAIPSSGVPWSTTVAMADAGHPALEVCGDGQGCGDIAGSYRVNEVT